jgi:hypothetical protein
MIDRGGRHSLGYKVLEKRIKDLSRTTVKLSEILEARVDRLENDVKYLEQAVNPSEDGDY